MIVAGDLKKGTTLRIEGTLYRVTNLVYNKPGRGTASMQTTLVDIASGATQASAFSRLMTSSTISMLSRKKLNSSIATAISCTS